jgi:hypothetical protein
VTGLPRVGARPLSLATGRHALAAPVSDPFGLPAALAALGLCAPRPVLVLVGGANGLDAGLRPILARVFWTLIPALRAVGAAVVDGGTRAGVMALLGEAAADSGLALVGVAAVGTVRLPPVTGAGAAGGGEVDHRADLDPGHGRFLLVPGTAWGDESPWLAAAASALAGRMPSLTLVAGGGAVTARDLREGLRVGRPALVLAGTGGIADSVAAQHRAGGPLPFDLPRHAAAEIEVMDLADAVAELPPLLLRVLGG